MLMWVRVPLSAPQTKNPMCKHRVILFVARRGDWNNPISSQFFLNPPLQPQPRELKVSQR